MRLPWPEIESQQRPGETVRVLLDYLSWITREMRQVGYHTDAARDRWRRRTHRAYSALFLPPLPGHGDPYPPDVPPAEAPGIWPDIPAVAIPGMTVRHQLKVIGMLAEELRDRIWIHTRPPEIEEWDRRLAQARELLDHGPELAIPEEARTQPSPEVLAEAQAQEQAVLDHARRRSQRLARLRKEASERQRARSGRSETPRAAVGDAAAAPDPARASTGGAKGARGAASSGARGKAGKAKGSSARPKASRPAAKGAEKAKKGTTKPTKKQVSAKKPAATKKVAKKTSARPKASGSARKGASGTASSPKTARTSKATPSAPKTAPKKKAKKATPRKPTRKT